ncbi:MAG: hypothetical protein OXH75_28750 [Acidobacteria bacterium]|nr:hypothetical protein [Acidobacteriota bacterium]
MSAGDDAVRKEHRELHPTEKAAVSAVKYFGQTLIDTCDTLGSSRELSIAKTKAEEAVMWAVKHITARGRRVPARRRGGAAASVTGPR